MDYGKRKNQSHDGLQPQITHYRKNLDGTLACYFLRCADDDLSVLRCETRYERYGHERRSHPLHHQLPFGNRRTRHLFSDARHQQRIPCVYHGQSFKPQNSLRRQGTRDLRHETRHGRERSGFHPLGCNEHACDDGHHCDLRAYSCGEQRRNGNSEHAVDYARFHLRRVRPLRLARRKVRREKYQTRGASALDYRCILTHSRLCRSETRRRLGILVRGYRSVRNLCYFANRT